MNIGEYGNVIRVDVGESIVGGDVTLTLQSPYTSNKVLVLNNANGVNVGTVDIITPIGTFKANEYIEYTLQSGDIDDIGLWQARVSSLVGGVKKITDKVVSFKVYK